MLLILGSTSTSSDRACPRCRPGAALPRLRVPASLQARRPRLSSRESPARLLSPPRSRTPPPPSATTGAPTAHPRLSSRRPRSSPACTLPRARLVVRPGHPALVLDVLSVAMDQCPRQPLHPMPSTPSGAFLLRLRGRFCSAFIVNCVPAHARRATPASCSTSLSSVRPLQHPHRQVPSLATRALPSIAGHRI
jgi:hypothetical protein